MSVSVARQRTTVLTRTAITRHLKMLSDAPMAGLVKLRCGIITDCGRRLWAGSVDAANREWKGAATHPWSATSPSRKITNANFRGSNRRFDQEPETIGRRLTVSARQAGMFLVR